MRLPSFELGCPAYETSGIANTPQDANGAAETSSRYTVEAVINPLAFPASQSGLSRMFQRFHGATSLDRTEFFRSSGGREHQLHQGCFDLADRVGFEPTERFRSSVFKTDAIDHSATYPNFVAGYCHPASPFSRSRFSGLKRLP